MHALAAVRRARGIHATILPTTMSLAKLTSVSTQTLSLLLERQRLMSMGQPSPNTQTQQIVRNLNNLRTGIVAFERSPQQGGNRESTEACRLLRSQFERMRGMLGDDGNAVEPCAFSGHLLCRDIHCICLLLDYLLQKRSKLAILQDRHHLHLSRSRKTHLFRTPTRHHLHQTGIRQICCKNNSY